MAEFFKSHSNQGEGDAESAADSRTDVDRLGCDLLALPDCRREWYVIKTKPRAERQTASVLTSRQITIYLPLLKRRKLHEPLFPGYMFLNIDVHSNEFLSSRSAPGVSYILSNDGVPIPVSADLIEQIRSRLDLENGLGPASRFKPGDRVIVNAGAFRDVEAIFDRALNAQGRCQVLLQLLGRQMRMQVDADQLAQAGNGWRR